MIPVELHSFLLLLSVLDLETLPGTLPFLLGVAVPLPPVDFGEAVPLPVLVGDPLLFKASRRCFIFG